MSLKRGGLSPSSSGISPARLDSQLVPDRPRKTPVSLTDQAWLAVLVDGCNANFLPMLAGWRLPRGPLGRLLPLGSAICLYHSLLLSGGGRFPRLAGPFDAAASARPGCRRRRQEETVALSIRHHRLACYNRCTRTRACEKVIFGRGTDSFCGILASRQSPRPHQKCDS